MRCENCAYYSPHPLYPFMGYCEKKGSVVFSGESCPEAVQKAMKDAEKLFENYGWAYCVDCGTVLFDGNELRTHLSMGHSVTQRFLEDEVATYESPGGD